CRRRPEFRCADRVAQHVESAPNTRADADTGWRWRWRWMLTSHTVDGTRRRDAMMISRRAMNAMRWTGVAIMLLALFRRCLVGRPTPLRAGDLGVCGTWKSNVSDTKEGTWRLAGTSTDLVINGDLRSTGPSHFAQGSIVGALAPTGEIHFGVVYDN